MKTKIISLLCLFFVNSYCAEKLRIGVLAFGTVNWELSVMGINKIAKKYDIDLSITKLSSKNAISVALNSGTVDIIVNDYIWVSRQRASGHDFTFYPYSKATGGLYVRLDQNIGNMLDLKNKKLGIAGGQVDKTWLISRAYFKSKYNLDLTKIVDPVFASPPILHRKMLDGTLPCVMNFWHYNAKLKANGMNKLIGIKEMLQELGINYDIPLIGWVFREKFARKNTKLINNFLQASYETKLLLRSSPKEWNKIRKLMKANDEKVFSALKEGYINGIPKNFGISEQKAAKKVFSILAKEGGIKLVGTSKTLQKGTFWKFNPNMKW